MTFQNQSPKERTRTLKPPTSSSPPFLVMGLQTSVSVASLCSNTILLISRKLFKWDTSQVELKGCLFRHVSVLLGLIIIIIFLKDHVLDLVLLLICPLLAVSYLTVNKRRKFCWIYIKGEKVYLSCICRQSAVVLYSTNYVITANNG